MSRWDGWDKYDEWDNPLASLHLDIGHSLLLRATKLVGIAIGIAIDS